MLQNVQHIANKYSNLSLLLFIINLYLVDNALSLAVNCKSDT